MRASYGVTRKQMENDDLTLLKDDMTAFIEGHGMRRFPAYVSEDMTTVMWEPGSNPDSWKDFVEVAKASGVAFMTMNAVLLERDDVDFLTDRLKHSYYSNDEDLEEARSLRTWYRLTGSRSIGPTRFPWPGSGSQTRWLGAPTISRTWPTWWASTMTLTRRSSSGGPTFAAAGSSAWFPCNGCAGPPAVGW